MISYELQGKVARIGMDDGKLNVVNPPFIEAFNAALDQAEADKAGAVILSGRAGSFSAGFDLKEFQKGPEATYGQVMGGFKLLLRLFEFNRPVIAECDGHGIGMGAFLLLVCDLRVASDGAHKISLPESRIGMELGTFLTAIAGHRISPKYMTRAAVMSEEMDPKTATEAGFLDQVVPGDSLRQTTSHLAEKLAAMPGIYGHNKKTVRGAALANMRDFLENFKG